MKKRNLLIIATILLSVVFSSCNNSSNNSKSDEKSEVKVDWIEQGKVIYLEDFSLFNNVEQVAEYFGEENVLSDIWYVAEGTEKYLVTIVNPNCRNKIVIYWDQESNDYKDYASVEARYSIYDNKSELTDEEGFSFPSKLGITIGATLPELEEILGEPVAFYGFDWDYGGTVTNDSDKLEGLVINVGFEKEDRTKTEADAYNKLSGDNEFSSNDPATKDLKIIVTNIFVTGGE